jgi:hypothetical protein
MDPISTKDASRDERPPQTHEGRNDPVPSPSFPGRAGGPTPSAGLPILHPLRPASLICAPWRLCLKTLGQEWLPRDGSPAIRIDPSPATRPRRRVPPPTGSQGSDYKTLKSQWIAPSTKNRCISQVLVLTCCISATWAQSAYGPASRACCFFATAAVDKVDNESASGEANRPP